MQVQPIIVGQDLPRSLSRFAALARDDALPGAVLSAAKFMKPIESRINLHLIHLSISIAKLPLLTQCSATARSLLRQYLEPMVGIGPTAHLGVRRQRTPKRTPNEISLAGSSGNRDSLSCAANCANLARKSGVSGPIPTLASNDLRRFLHF